MQGDLIIPISLLLSFLLVLVRVSGALVFVPLPGVRTGAEPARVVLALALTLVLMPKWPTISALPSSVGTLAGWVISEAAIGIGMGVVVAFVLEAFTLSAQFIGLQAGYAYASMVDPNTQADSGILLVLASLVSGVLFFVLGLDREVIRIFADSLSARPPGSVTFTATAGAEISRVGSTMFLTAARLSLPLVALMILVDVSLALMGRVSAQLQLLMLAFPVKMLLALLMLSWIIVLLPQVYRAFGLQALGVARGVFAR